MDSSLFHQLVAIESAPASTESISTRPPLRPQKSITKTDRDVSGLSRHDEGTFIELAHITRPATHTGGYEPATATHRSGTGTPADLEMSRPVTPMMAPDDGVEALQSVWDPYMNRYRLLSACLINFANGMSDSASGPLIPYMEKYYNIGYAMVSLIFVGQAIGFIMGASLIDPLRERMGRGRSLALSQLFMIAGYLLIVCGAPFPAVVVGFFLIGLGMSINLALGNIFCGSLTNSTTALGFMHGSYGIGGVCGPLLANAFVAPFHLVWSRYYLLTMGLSILNGLFVLWAYWNFEAEHPENSVNAPATAAMGPLQPTISPISVSRLHNMLPTFSSSIVLLGALFIFAYQGAEVSISGWVISFLEETRGGDPSRVGYVTSGFWAGITLGRLVLSTPAQKIGEKTFVYGVLVGAAVFELLVWLVPNIVGDAVAVAVVGLLLGPVYPCATAIFMRTMSRSEKVSGIGIISAFGSSGGAAAPFTTGLLSQAVGTFVLHPIAIGLFVVMLVTWYCLPSDRKRRE